MILGSNSDNPRPRLAGFFFACSFPQAASKSNHEVLALHLNGKTAMDLSLLTRLNRCRRVTSAKRSKAQTLTAIGPSQRHWRSLPYVTRPPTTYGPHHHAALHYWTWVPCRQARPARGQPRLQPIKTRAMLPIPIESACSAHLVTARVLAACGLARSDCHLGGLARPIRYIIPAN